jgi:hypothetical protein
MGRTRKAYAPEFRRRRVELVRAGRSPESLAKEFEPSANAIRIWAQQADRDEGVCRLPVLDHPLDLGRERCHELVDLSFALLAPLLLAGESRSLFGAVVVCGRIVHLPAVFATLQPFLFSTLRDPLISPFFVPGREFRV